MPYSSTSSLPKQVQGLPSGAKKIWMAAFNSAYKKHGEESAFKIAWSAVKRSYKKKGEEWVTKDSGEQEFEETMMFDGSSLRATADGFMVASPLVARMGVQIYRGWELGNPDVEEARVYRPEDSVFAQDSMSTYAYRPITFNHPHDLVSPQNYKDVSVGFSGAEIARDGDFLRVPMVLMDAAAIKAVKDQRQNELSVGYVADIEWVDGVTPGGEKYNAIQRNIRANHIAIVSQARGGSNLRLGDGSEGEDDMPINERKFTIDGVEFTMGDTEGSMLQSIFSRLAGELKAVKDSLLGETKKVETKDGELTAMKKQLETKDGEITALNKKIEDAKLTPDQIEKLVADRAAVVVRAKIILGDSYDPKGKSDAAIRRDAVSKALGDVEAKSMTDDNINGAFLALTKPTEGISDGGSSFKDFASVVGHRPSYVNDAEKAFAEQGEYLTNAWKGTQPQARQ